MKETDELILKQVEMIDFFLHPSCNEDQDLRKYNKLKAEIDHLRNLYEKNNQEFTEIPETPKKPKLQRMITQQMIRKEFEEETNEFPVQLDYKGRIIEANLDYIDWLEFKLIDVSIKLNQKIKNSEVYVPG